MEETNTCRKITSELSTRETGDALRAISDSHTEHTASLYRNNWLLLLYSCRKATVLFWLTTDLKVLLIRMCFLTSLLGYPIALAQ